MKWANAGFVLAWDLAKVSGVDVFVLAGRISVLLDRVLLSGWIDR